MEWNTWNVKGGCLYGTGIRILLEKFKKGGKNNKAMWLNTAGSSWKRWS